MDDLAAEIACAEAQARLQRQVARLAEGRSMASFLLGATGVTASFLGAKAVHPHHVGALDVIGLIVLILGLACAVLVLRPIPDSEPREIAELPVTELTCGQREKVTWRGNLPVAHVERLNATASHETELRMAVAKELEARATIDATFLDRRLQLVRACGALLVIQVLVWFVDVAH